MTDFDEIYRRYFNDVYLYIRRLSGDENMAEEITADTFYKAIKSIDSFRGDCDVRVWLCQIAKNSYYTCLNKNKRLEVLDDNFSADGNEKSFTDKLEEKDTAKHIQKILHSINEPYKEVFMWRVYAGMSFREIGRIFAKSENRCRQYQKFWL